MPRKEDSPEYDAQVTKNLARIGRALHGVRDNETFAKRMRAIGAVEIPSEKDPKTKEGS